MNLLDVISAMLAIQGLALEHVNCQQLIPATMKAIRCGTLTVVNFSIVVLKSL